MGIQKKALDLIGKRIGKLVVISRAESINENGAIRARWFCRCDCGGSIVASTHSLQKGIKGTGGTRSCRCLMGTTVQHGQAQTRVYRVWASMCQRCGNANNPAFKYYGGRGITVCESWRSSFTNFFADMGSPPKGYSLDRIDNSLGYYKENCRWVSKKVQGNNRRSNRFLELGDQRLTLAQWSEKTGLSAMCIRIRLDKGWSVEKTLTTPLMTRRKSTATAN